MIHHNSFVISLCSCLGSTLYPESRKKKIDHFVYRPLLDCMQFQLYGKDIFLNSHLISWANTILMYFKSLESTMTNLWDCLMSNMALVFAVLLHHHSWWGKYTLKQYIEWPLTPPRRHLANAALDGIFIYVSAVEVALVTEAEKLYSSLIV